MAVRSVAALVCSRGETAGNETKRTRSVGISVPVRSRALDAFL